MENKNSIYSETADLCINRNERKDLHGYGNRLQLDYRKLEMEGMCSDRDKKNVKEFYNCLRPSD